MKKDIEWLKSAIQQNLDFYNDNDEEWQMAKVRAYAKSLDLINQLDEPEVLSQELIYEKAIDTHVDTANGEIQVTFILDDLQNLLVPKQEEKKESPVALMARAYQNLGIAIKNSTDRRQAELELNRLGYVVIERPTIPKFVADWIEASRHTMYHLLGAIYDGAYSEDMKEWLFKGDKRTRQDNQDKLTRAWVHGYEIEVEEEQKYIVLSKDKRTILLTRWADEATPCAEPITEKEERDKLTEQEIKDYDPRYFAFAVKVEELEE